MITNKIHLMFAAVYFMLHAVLYAMALSVPFFATFAGWLVLVYSILAMLCAAGAVEASNS